MTRGWRWTEQDIRRLKQRSITEQRYQRRKPLLIAHRWICPIQLPDGGWLLTFSGRLPEMNKECPDWRKRWGLKNACLKQFGMLPFPETRKAVVKILRVLGPRERIMDKGNLVYACKGAEDSLTNAWTTSHGKRRGGGNYIVDDSPEYATFDYNQDVTRRQEGPKIEILIVYEEV